MEKRRPSHDLRLVKQALADPARLAITSQALRDALSTGFDRTAICETIRALDQSMFVKSMTTHADHRTWQDVYHVPVEGLVIYLKFQNDLVTEFRLVSFKER